MRDSVSTPITSTVSAIPAPTWPRARSKPKTNPVHAAKTSYAAAFVAPSFRCSVQAHDGRMRSGVVVASTIWSTSSAFTFAISSARWQAISAMSLEPWSGAAMRRSRMPVRSTIHSSDVSTSFSRSWFVNTRSGTYMPVPVMVMPRIPSGRRVMVRLDLLADVLVDALLDERGERVDRAPERARAARAVADEADAVDAEQRRGAVLLPVDACAQPRQRALHEQRTEHGERVLLHLVTHRAAEEAGRALRGLQEHVAREAIGHHDVARALEQV